MENQSADIWPYNTNTETNTFYETRSGDLFWKGVIAATALGSGSIKVKDKKLWDFYVTGMRNIEEYSPGAFLRTFQLSNFFSQFETLPDNKFFISPEALQQNNNYRK